jgi:hypothetical protein
MKPIDPFAVHPTAATLQDTNARPPEDSAKQVEIVIIKMNSTGIFRVLFYKNPCRHHLI